MTYKLPYTELAADTTKVQISLIDKDFQITSVEEQQTRINDSKGVSQTELEIARLAQWFLNKAPTWIREGSAVDNAIYYLEERLSHQHTMKDR
jgi:hypothetical protein